ncbi:hypothetical protein ABZ547_08260 [Streptomyces sparsogenes]|uniref:hypothetical protein n=1 Tax=Streptomyces sparsogenes TaxID=67365 RepID=UPI0033CB6B27
MTAKADTRTWHHLRQHDGAPYPVRHQPPTGLTNTNWDTHYQTLGMTAGQGNYAHCVHEAAHAVTALVGGGHVCHARVNIPCRPGRLGAGDAVFGGLHDAREVAAIAAGERAENRWLQEAGLWTPRRAIAVEINASTDRRACTSRHPHFGFGDTKRDYLTAHDAADRIIDRHWAEINTVAAELLKRHTLTGDQIADLIRIPNGTHPAA